MLNAIITWSLHNRLIVLAGALIFVVAGAVSLPNLPIDAFPDTTPVQVQINTTVPGLAPEDVERLITFPVEHAVRGLPHVQQMRSLSKFGLSQVVVVFEDGTDIYFARQLINEQLGGVEVPEASGKPHMGPVATGLGEVFHYTLRSQQRDLTELRTMQDWVIKPALRSVPGTAEINGWGGQEKQYQIRFDPVRLLKHELTLDQVMQSVRANNLNVGGGNLQQAGAAYLVQGIGYRHDAEQVRDIVVATPRKGMPIRVRDVADVMEGYDIRVGGVTAQGQGEVVLGLGFMLMGENSHRVTTRLKARLAEVKKTLPTDVKVDVVYDRTELVDKVIDTVRKNLFEGGLLVIAVLFVFLGNLRAGLIVATAIPLSMLFAFTGMLRYGIAGSLLSLGAIDFGLVVDSSVVMIENCVRHLAHHSSPGGRGGEGAPSPPTPLPQGESGERAPSPPTPLPRGERGELPPSPLSPRGRGVGGEGDHLQVIQDAALEVRKPTMFGELIIMIVYLPILTLEGVEGKLFRPMALTVIFALLGSLIMSLTLMPVLASLLLPRKMEERDPWIVRLFSFLYRPVLRLAMRQRPGSDRADRGLPRPGAADGPRPGRRIRAAAIGRITGDRHPAFARHRSR